MWQCSECGRNFKNTNQDHYCSKKPATIDEYIEDQPENIRPLLEKIRKTIRKAAPKAIEKISWRMPTFWQSENLIHFAAFKKHISIMPGDITKIPFEKELSGYKTSRGAIQFPLDKPIDYNLISEITKFKVSMVSEKVLRSNT